MSTPVISGVPTSLTAFVGIAGEGPVNVATSLSSFAEFQTSFGGLASASDLSYAIYQFFLNGGAACCVVGVPALTEQTFAVAAAALGAVPLINLLCLPGVHDPELLNAANLYAASRRALLIADADPNANTAALLRASICSLKLPQPDSAAIYAPWLRIPDPLNNGAPLSVAPSGTMAGVYAASDSARGVWSAPAGPNVEMLGVDCTAFSISDAQGDDVNARGVNVFRNFPDLGIIPWGARTMAGQDSQWAYVPVRRLSLYIEQSLYSGTQWVVFEPNGPRLWATVHESIEAFLQQLFERGAFAGQTADQAYFVRCDQTTMTQAEIQGGLLNIVVGVAPVYPGEFVIFRIQQFTA